MIMAKKTYYNIHEAKTHLSRIADFVAAGGEVVVGKSGKPLMILVPYDESRLQRRKLGFARGMGEIKADFFDPLSPDDLGDME